MQIGADLLFWYHYTQVFKKILIKDHYIPALKYHKPGKGSRFEIYPAWEIISEKHDNEIKDYASWDRKSVV